jgi:peptidylprolyl isomerase
LGVEVTLICKAECRQFGVVFLAIQKGNVVKLHYDAKIGDQVIDTSRDKIPLEFKVGEGKVLKGLDEAVVGLDVGTKKTVVIPPEKGYGLRKDGLFTEVARDKSKEPEAGIVVGHVVCFKTDLGALRYGTVSKVEEDTITLDLNHPLAGQTITFDLEIVEVKQQPDATEE